MLQERLLERIRWIEQDPDHRGVVDPQRVISSIMVHLQKILNTRQGSAPIDDDYGVPDFTDLAATFSSESVRDIVRSVRQVIQKYDPRLSSVQIEAEPQGQDVLELHFKIEGKLSMGQNVEVPVAFETIIDPDGRIQVSK
jgi:type VI secretion system protein